MVVVLTRRSGGTNLTLSLIEQNRVSPFVSSRKKLLKGIPMSLVDFFTFDQPTCEHQYVFLPMNSWISAVMGCGCC